MAKNKLKSEKTELRLLREKYNVTTKELCLKLGMQEGLYSAHETGARRYKPERYEQFIQQVEDALEEIAWERYQLSQKLPEKYITDDGFEDEDLIYQPVTYDLLEEALILLKQGYNITQIAIRLEVCEIELGKRIKGEQERILQLVEDAKMLMANGLSTSVVASKLHIEESELLIHLVDNGVEFDLAEYTYEVDSLLMPDKLVVNE